MRTIAIVLPPCSGTVLIVDASPFVQGKGIDPSGVTDFRASDGTPIELHIKADGYQDYDTLVDVPKSGNVQIRVGIAEDPNAPVKQVVLPPMLPLKPPAPPTPPLIVEGNDFVNEQGQRISLCGCDGFMDYRLWLDGREGALEPFMRESQETGFQLRRVFLQGSIRQNQVMDLWPQREPDYYPQLEPFVRYQNAHGIITLLTVYVDNQDIGLPTSHWSDVNRILADAGGLSYLISGGNEADKNGFDPNGLPPPPVGVFWSRGSLTEDRTQPNHGATASEFHPVRGRERTQMDAVASVFGMRDLGATGMLWMDEGVKFQETADEGGGKFNDPTLAFALGRVYSTYWGLAVFHNFSGQRGQLMPANTRRCADAWVEGMRL